MTITTQTLRKDYTANGVNTTFAFDFPIFYESNATPKFSLEVIITDTLGVEATKIETTDYTITYNQTDYLNGVIAQGNVVLNIAPTLNYKVSILRKLNFTQNNDITTSGTDALPGTALEGSLDKLTLMLLETKENLNRVVKLPKSSILTNIEFPIGASQANQVIAINNDGNNLTTKDLADVGLAPVSTFAKTLLDDLTAAQARTTLDAQQLNANLTALAGLTGALNKLPYFNGLGSMVLRDLFATSTIQGISYLKSNTNLIINGGMDIDQRNAGNSQTITAGSTLAYTVDRWYAYCSGANCSGQRVAGTTPNQFNYRFTGATSVSKIGFAQRIEATNSQHLANQFATLSVDLANSLLTTITWTAFYANTKDTFGTLASPTKTQIATGTFTVNSTLTRYSTNISIPSAAITGIEIEFSVGAQTSGTWTIGRVQLESNLESTPFENRSIQQEIFLCGRYYELMPISVVAHSQFSNQIRGQLKWNYEKRATPTLTFPAANTLTVYYGSTSKTGSGSINADFTTTKESMFYFTPSTNNTLDTACGVVGSNVTISSEL
jgi:hypothetical protein